MSTGIELVLVAGQSGTPKMTFTPGSPQATVALGSSPACQWSINGNGVEANHAELGWDGNNLWIRSLTPQPIFVGSTQVGPNWHQLRPGERVVIGQAALMTQSASVRATAGVAAAPAADQEATRVGAIASPLASSNPESTVIVQSPYDGGAGLPPLAGGGGVKPPMVGGGAMPAPAYVPPPAPAYPQPTAPPEPPPAAAGEMTMMFGQVPIAPPTSSKKTGGGSKIVVLLLLVLIAGAGAAFVFLKPPPQQHTAPPPLQPPPRPTTPQMQFSPPLAGPAVGPQGLALVAATDNRTVQPIPAPPPRRPGARVPPPPPPPPPTQERLAADAVVGNNFVEALRLYRALAQAHPEVPAYAQMTQILQRRLELQHIQRNSCQPGGSCPPMVLGATPISVSAPSE